MAVTNGEHCNSFCAANCTFYGTLTVYYNINTYVAVSGNTVLIVVSIVISATTVVLTLDC